ncbi:DUF6379 domain-containing protein [Microbacterium trichothecenolyticum]|uniref:C-glycoside deglycosidase beta subunit domain-containing protein n=1 Tax=Microbacterium trichothecenolyticum TaxID=69370 RepID=UPI0035BE7CB7
MLPEQIIERGTLRAADGRISVSVRMPWYRALPLSSIAAVRMNVDGIELPSEDLVWQTTDGDRYRLDELPARHDRWWFVLDSATLEGPMPDISDVADHEVQVAIGLYIPYVPSAQGPPLLIENDRKTMTLEQAA